MPGKINCRSVLRVTIERSFPRIMILQCLFHNACFTLLEPGSCLDLNVIASIASVYSVLTACDLTLGIPPIATVELTESADPIVGAALRIFLSDVDNSTFGHS